MSDVVIFTVGCLMFVATTWATISFGLVRMHDLKRQDLEAGGGEIKPTESGFTEIHAVADGR